MGRAVKTMKPRRILPILFAAHLALGACTSPKSSTAALPSLDSRLSRDWLASASRIRSGERTVYYHGSAHRTAGTSRIPWHGTISGDILALSPTGALVCPSGTVELGPDNRITVNGPSRTNVVAHGKGRWQHLLE